MYIYIWLYVYCIQDKGLKTTRARNLLAVVWIMFLIQYILFLEYGMWQFLSLFQTCFFFLLFKALHITTPAMPPKHGRWIHSSTTRPGPSGKKSDLVLRQKLGEILFFWRIEWELPKGFCTRVPGYRVPGGCFSLLFQGVICWFGLVFFEALVVLQSWTSAPRFYVLTYLLKLRLKNLFGRKDYTPVQSRDDWSFRNLRDFSFIIELGALLSWKLPEGPGQRIILNEESGTCWIWILNCDC